MTQQQFRNEISRIRADCINNGEAKVTPEQYDRLQREWILRCGADELLTEVTQERQAYRQALMHLMTMTTSLLIGAANRTTDFTTICRQTIARYKKEFDIK